MSQSCVAPSHGVVQMCVDIEKKALWVREQQEEYRRVHNAYLQQTATMEATNAEKRSLQTRLRQAEAEAKRDGHLRK